ncbi:hypothetical protein CLOSTMETH_03254 [[Clostridium] methylpentosum DSM 5476]|uniref:Uncharacterized protein n=1 Tax=[Clostridium] methylpentosum DSM 5476 TaxID=537013 RepID=C0EH54_9FIRM|nr:hypothetical protein CLOSTMETH_03254 [[Clostridium] methylpentosum DSM 5476]
MEVLSSFVRCIQLWKRTLGFAGREKRGEGRAICGLKKEDVKRKHG